MQTYETFFLHALEEDLKNKVNIKEVNFKIFNINIKFYFIFIFFYHEK